MKIAVTNLLKWKHLIEATAKGTKLPGCVVAAIISRETDAREIYCLPPMDGGKLGDGGYGHGPMQIDKRSFPEWCEGWRNNRYTLVQGIQQGCAVLRQKQHSIRVLIPEMPEDIRLRAAIAAYNCGEGNVRKAYRAGKSVDLYTAHRNYSQDVLERAEFLKTKHDFSPL